MHGYGIEEDRGLVALRFFRALALRDAPEAGASRAAASRVGALRAGVSEADTATEPVETGQSSGTITLRFHALTVAGTLEGTKNTLIFPFKRDGSQKLRGA